ncbi:MAG: hypothetical protein M3O50_10565, partial [Myxococcota bacterium]|nr:hypothetical protein [Myxococcota bacterium]
NTIRGENVMQTLGNQQSASYRAGIANGGSVQAQLTYPTPGQPSSAWHNPVIEPINAVVTSWSKEVYVQNSDPDAPQHTIDCGPQVKTQNYDAASRLGSRTVSMTVTSTAPDCAGAVADSRDTPSYTYDAEDHHTTIGNDDLGLTESLRWSPTGRAYSVTYNNQTYGVHYDGDRILFISDSNGALMTAKIETLANYTPSGGLVAVDRGITGDYVSQHNGTFYGGVSIGSTVYKNFQTQEIGSVPYIFYGSTNDALCRRGTTTTPAGCAGAPNMEYARQEGFQFFGLTIQGKRAVEASTGQWTSPDAFAGVVHDPMSQKSFMWDNNNPYAYSDPTGFSINVMVMAGEDGAGIMAHGGGAQPSYDVASRAYGAGQYNSPAGMARDINNAIVIAYTYETSPQTGTGSFKPGEVADIVAHHLATADFGGGYQTTVTSAGKGSERVSVTDPRAHLNAEITVNSSSTTIVTITRYGTDTGYGGVYRLQGSDKFRTPFSKKTLEYHPQGMGGSFWEQGHIWFPDLGKS